jgi:hypothetical protein
MLHVPSDHSLLPQRVLLACPLLLLTALGCSASSEGDDLPPGAFTTGGDDVVDPSDTEDTDGTTTAPPGDDTTTTSSPDTGSSDDVPPGMVSYADDIQPIWEANTCLISSCHDNDVPTAGLDLLSDGARDRLCSTYSTTQASLLLVDCEGLDYEASWLWSKVTGEGLEAPGAGALMPVSGMLSAGDIATIEAWIEGGALP